MNVEALLNLRNQIDERLVELRAELEKQLARPKGKSLKGKKVPPKYRSPSGETWAGRGAKPEVDGGGQRCQSLVLLWTLSDLLKIIHEVRTGGKLQTTIVSVCRPIPGSKTPS
jgi:hypothetical protein